MLSFIYPPFSSKSASELAMASFRDHLLFFLFLFFLSSVVSPASSISESRGKWKKEGLHSHNLMPRRARSLAEAPASAQAPSPAKSTHTPSSQTTSKTSPSPSPSASASSSSSKKKPLWVRWLAGIALGVVSGIISAIIVSALFHCIHDWIIKGKPNKPVVFQRNIDMKSLAFLEKDNAFDNLEVLGKGGSGEVYKATIQIKSTKDRLNIPKVVAIKKVTGLANVNTNKGVDSSLERSYDLTKNSAQIRAEMDTLGHVRHRNLVTLLAYVPKTSAHVLVYDFMENGSLHDILWKVREGSLELPWPIRFNIAKGVAHGLKYLHFDAKPKIIHRDLKPGNILLDANMEAHIGDFGLAKVMPDAMTHFTSNNLAGTVGYIAPEYHQTLKYTSRGDIYSFGVVLVVLLTGRQPNDSMFSEVYTHMGSWVNVVLGDREQTLSVIDPSLRGQGFEEQMFLIFKIASFCLQDLPSARPSSNDIVKMFDQVERPNLGTPLPNVALPSSPPQEQSITPTSSTFTTTTTTITS